MEETVTLEISSDEIMQTEFIERVARNNSCWSLTKDNWIKTRLIHAGFDMTKEFISHVNPVTGSYIYTQKII